MSAHDPSGVRRRPPKYLRAVYGENPHFYTALLRPSLTFLLSHISGGIKSMSDIVILAIWLVFVLLSLGFFKLLTGFLESNRS